MKKMIQTEVIVCDKCGAQESYMNECMTCGTEFCYECWKKHGKEYSHGVYLRGSGDGYYCNPCDAKLTKSGADKRHSAYRVIESLRSELEAWTTDFKGRQEKAEKALKTIL